VSVLLVDDQAIVGEGVRRMLQPEGDIEFEYCQDPARAFERAARGDVTVILLDLVMPGTDGRAVLASLRADERTREIPVIVLSAKEEAQTKADAFAAGAHDYIVKLPDPVELIARVRHHSAGYIAALELNEAYAALERSQQTLARELAEAAKYVRSLLPEPLTGAFASDWRFIPSVQLGGDSFGYDRIDADRFALFLLDVSGHVVVGAQPVGEDAQGEGLADPRRAVEHDGESPGAEGRDGGGEGFLGRRPRDVGGAIGDRREGAFHRIALGHRHRASLERLPATNPSGTPDGSPRKRAVCRKRFAARHPPGISLGRDSGVSRNFSRRCRHSPAAVSLHS
jgi:CheY-like chemotaxis protein